MKQLNLAEAKAEFSELVDAAARGDGTIIAKSGTPVAMLVPRLVPFPSRRGS